MKVKVLNLITFEENIIDYKDLIYELDLDNNERISYAWKLYLGEYFVIQDKLYNKYENYIKQIKIFDDERAVNKFLKELNNFEKEVKISYDNGKIIAEYFIEKEEQK